MNDDRVHVDTMAAEHTTASSSPHARRTDAAFRNHDLKAEAREAQKPTVRFAFEFPELPVAFEAADEVASTSRDRSRRLGVLPGICSKARTVAKGTHRASHVVGNKLESATRRGSSYTSCTTTGRASGSASP